MRRALQSTPITSGRRGRPRAHEPPVLAELEARFARFRREHSRGTRVPEDLRAAALAALREGVGPAALHRTCGVSWSQIEAWKGGRRSTSAKPATTEPTDVRVFSVVEDQIREPTASPGHELDLRLGPWSISVRLVEPRPAGRG